MLHVISLAQYAAAYSRSWAVDSMNGRVRLKAENNRLIEEVARLREEIRSERARLITRMQGAKKSGSPARPPSPTVRRVWQCDSITGHAELDRLFFE